MFVKTGDIVDDSNTLKKTLYVLSHLNIFNFFVRCTSKGENIKGVGIAIANTKYECMK